MVPVYLITGFLDSGKTTFLRDTLQDSEFLDGEDNTHAKSSEVGLGSLISKEDGDMEDSKPHDTDSFAQMQSPQQWGAVGRRNTSNTI